ncbi:hypothetical protein TraAM80_10541, partial [Trypanosoma rangeli]
CRPGAPATWETPRASARWSRESAFTAQARGPRRGPLRRRLWRSPRRRAPKAPAGCSGRKLDRRRRGGKNEAHQLFWGCWPARQTGGALCWKRFPRSKRGTVPKALAWVGLGGKRKPTQATAICLLRKVSMSGFFPLHENMVVFAFAVAIIICGRPGASARQRVASAKAKCVGAACGQGLHSTKHSGHIMPRRRLKRCGL